MGLEADLNEQIKYNKRHGGPSEALRKLRPRPSGVSNWRTKATLGVLRPSPDLVEKVLEDYKKKPTRKLKQWLDYWEIKYEDSDNNSNK